MYRQMIPSLPISLIVADGQELTSLKRDGVRIRYFFMSSPPVPPSTSRWLTKPHPSSAEAIPHLTPPFPFLFTTCNPSQDLLSCTCLQKSQVSARLQHSPSPCRACYLAGRGGKNDRCRQPRREPVAANQRPQRSPRMLSLHVPRMPLRHVRHHGRSHECLSHRLHHRLVVVRSQGLGHDNV